jgi:hypothetical protein
LYLWGSIKIYHVQSNGKLVLVLRAVTSRAVSWGRIKLVSRGITAHSTDCKTKKHFDTNEFPPEILLCGRRRQHDCSATANTPPPPASYPTSSSIQLRRQSVIVRQDCTWPLYVYATNWGVSNAVFPAKEQSLAPRAVRQYTSSHSDVKIKRTICSHSVNPVIGVIG